MSRTYDHLADEVLAAFKTLHLVTADTSVVADEEREAISLVKTLVMTWSVEDRRRH